MPLPSKGKRSGIRIFMPLPRACPSTDRTPQPQLSAGSEKNQAGQSKALSRVSHILFVSQFLRIANPVALRYEESKFAEVIVGVVR